MRLDAEAFHRRIAELLQQRKNFVVAGILEVKGSCPQKPGAKMIVHRDGTFEFTIGGGTFEAEVIQDAMAAFGKSVPTYREYRLTKADLGMYCQGLVKVIFESYRPRPQLLIFGGGHVGQALAGIAGASELFNVIVIDDRKEYASRRRHPAANRVIFTDRTFQKHLPSIDEETYIVIVTRCHATDKLLVNRLLNAQAAYLGLIGSEAKIRQFRHELTQECVASPSLQRLHAPIGLPLGGKDPAEIAVSIMAELVQVKHARSQAQPAVTLHLKNQPR